MTAKIHKFPTPPLTESELAEVREMFTAKPLTRAQLRRGPIEKISAPGPWISPPDSDLSDKLLRVRAIIAGLLGPGRVPLAEGIEVALEILHQIEEGVGP